MSVPTELAEEPAPIRAPEDTVTAPVVPVPRSVPPELIAVELLAVEPVTDTVPALMIVEPE